MYLGDGCFGRPPRTGDQAQRLDDPITYPTELGDLGLTTSYLANWQASNHFWVVTVPAGNPLDNQSINFEAYNEIGTLLDATLVSTGDFASLPIKEAVIAVILMFTGLVLLRKYQSN